MARKKSADETITVAVAADELGISSGLVRRLCRKANIGTLVTPQLRLLKRSDLALIQAERRPIGRPRS